MAQNVLPLASKNALVAQFLFDLLTDLALLLCFKSGTKRANPREIPHKPDVLRKTVYTPHRRAQKKMKGCCEEKSGESENGGWGLEVGEFY